jgi:hypothetical protein
MIDAADAIEELQKVNRERTELYEDAVKQLPKRAEWRPIQIGRWRGFECTNCKICQEVPTGNGGKPQWKYCHECGAKMFVSDINVANKK